VPLWDKPVVANTDTSVIGGKDDHGPGDAELLLRAHKSI